VQYTVPGRPAKSDGEAYVELRGRCALTGNMGKAWNDWQEYLKSLDPPPDRLARQSDIREQLWEMAEQAKADEVAARNDDNLALADKCAARLMGLLTQLRKLDGLDEPARVDVTSQGGPVVGPLDRLAGILGE
jgi:hypothetical protein